MRNPILITLVIGVLMVGASQVLFPAWGVFMGGLNQCAGGCGLSPSRGGFMVGNSTYSEGTNWWKGLTLKLSLTSVRPVTLAFDYSNASMGGRLQIYQISLPTTRADWSVDIPWRADWWILVVNAVNLTNSFTLSVNLFYTPPHLLLLYPGIVLFFATFALTIMPRLHRAGGTESSLGLGLRSSETKPT